MNKDRIFHHMQLIFARILKSSKIWQVLQGNSLLQSSYEFLTKCTRGRISLETYNKTIFQRNNKKNEILMNNFSAEKQGLTCLRIFKKLWKLFRFILVLLSLWPCGSGQLRNWKLYVQFKYSKTSFCTGKINRTM